MRSQRRPAGVTRARGSKRLPTPSGVVPSRISGRLRRALALLAVLSAVTVLLLAWAHSGSAGPDAFDRSVTAMVRSQWPRAGVLSYLVDGLAAPVSAVSLVGVLAVGCLLVRRWRLAALAAVGPLSAAATATVVKPVVGRTIHGENLAFPSGHTAFAAAFALVLGLLVVGMLQLRRVLGGILLLAITLLGGAGMALNQVVLDAHYPSDTVGGFFTATAVVSLAALLIDLLPGRYAEPGG